MKQPRSKPDSKHATPRRGWSEDQLHGHCSPPGDSPASSPLNGKVLHLRSRLTVPPALMLLPITRDGSGGRGRARKSPFPSDLLGELA